MGDPNNPDGYEVKHLDLSGIIFDIAAHGWAGSQKEPGRPDNVVHPNPQRRLAKFDERRAARQGQDRRAQSEGPSRDCRRGGIGPTWRATRHTAVACPSGRPTSRAMTPCGRVPADARR